MVAVVVWASAACRVPWASGESWRATGGERRGWRPAGVGVRATTCEDWGVGWGARNALPRRRQNCVVPRSRGGRVRNVASRRRAFVDNFRICVFTRTNTRAKQNQEAPSSLVALHTPPKKKRQDNSKTPADGAPHDDGELNTNPPTPCQIGKRPPAPKPKRESAGHHGAPHE